MRQIPWGTCLRCGAGYDYAHQARRENGLVCGLVDADGDLVQEWPEHHWRDWSDGELARFGLRPEVFEEYRRVDESVLSYLPCEDYVRGHEYAEATISLETWELRTRGECVWCGSPQSGKCELCGSAILRMEHVDATLAPCFGASDYAERSRARKRFRASRGWGPRPAEHPRQVYAPDVPLSEEELRTLAGLSPTEPERPGDQVRTTLSQIREELGLDEEATA